MLATLKQFLKRTPLYGWRAQLQRQSQLRRARQLFESWTTDDQSRLDFYRSLIPESGLVFDVGCNHGNRAKIFVRLAARVIGVEPQPACARFLKSVFENEPRFVLEQTALGAVDGHAEMLVSSSHTISSLSNEWVNAVKASGRFGSSNWNESVRVPVTTLDRLIAKHGIPAFIKIDVEGFEDQVLAGLSQPVPLLSLEFTPEFLSSTWKCVDHLSTLGPYEYQISLGESMTFAQPAWMSSEQLKNVMEEVPRKAFGDIYARWSKSI